MNRDKINRLIKEISISKNWIEAFNTLEDKLLEKYLDKLVEVTNFKEKEFNNLYIDVYGLQEKVDDVETDNIENLIDSINKFKKEYEDIGKIYEVSLKKYVRELDTLYECVKQYKEEFDNNIRIYTAGNCYIDANVLYSRICLLDKKIKSIGKSINLSNLAIDADMDYLLDSIKILISFANRKINRLRDKKQEQIKHKKKYRKIFDYKEMVRLAEKNNFEYVRSNGDHDIYMHKDTYKVVVIPQHNLGYGLMIDIQKQIQDRCVA